MDAQKDASDDLSKVTPFKVTIHSGLGQTADRYEHGGRFAPSSWPIAALGPATLHNEVAAVTLYDPHRGPRPF